MGRPPPVGGSSSPAPPPDLDQAAERFRLRRPTQPSRVTGTGGRPCPQWGATGWAAAHHLPRHTLARVFPKWELTIGLILGPRSSLPRPPKPAFPPKIGGKV